MRLRIFVDEAADSLTAQMAWPGDEALARDAADPPLGDGVGPWRPHRRGDDVNPDRGEHRIKRRGEPRVTVADEEPQLLAAPAQIHQRLRTY
jgi:hypothetical protein